MMTVAFAQQLGLTSAKGGVRLGKRKEFKLKGKDRTFHFAGGSSVTVPRAQRLIVREDGTREVFDAYGKRHVIAATALAWSE